MKTYIEHKGKKYEIIRSYIVSELTFECIHSLLELGWIKEVEDMELVEETKYQEAKRKGDIARGKDDRLVEETKPEETMYGESLAQMCKPMDKGLEEKIEYVPHEYGNDVIVGKIVVALNKLISFHNK